MFHVDEGSRQSDAEKNVYGTSGDGGNGIFKRKGPLGDWMIIIASNGLGWEHVSVSIEKADRCPTWKEMCFVKDLFWDEEDVVMQLHPAKSMNVNFHEYCLHMWRPGPEAILAGHRIPMPKTLLVGPEGSESEWNPRVPMHIKILNGIISMLKGGA